MDEILSAMKQAGMNVPLKAGSPGWDNFGNYVAPTVDAGAHFTTVAEVMKWAVAEIARARIAGVIAGREEAARVADSEADDIARHTHKANDGWQAGRAAMAQTIATAIRSLPTPVSDGGA